MKPLRLKIQEEAIDKKAPLPVIEKDYALSYILAGIAGQPQLAKTLVFKGGTALKKNFFGDYRFSEDLDFSVIDAPQGKSLEKALIGALDISKELLNQYGAFELSLKRNPEQAPHPRGQDAFNIYVKFPWHRSALCRVKIEITHDELVILPPEYKSILHDYNEAIDCKVTCYQIEEIITEKLRALLQTHQKLVARGWNRPRARDYYDLWRILKHYSGSIKHECLLEVLNKKCKLREVSFVGIDDFFTHELVNEARQHWQATLGALVPDLPECDEVLEQTKRIIFERIINTVTQC